MLEQAEDTAERLGGGLVTREAAECRAALAAISGSSHTGSDCRFRPDASACTPLTLLDRTISDSASCSSTDYRFGG
jgi:hypothetical protein